MVLDFSGWTPNVNGAVNNLLNSSSPLVLTNGGQLQVRNTNSNTLNVEQDFNGTTLSGLGTSSITGLPLGGNEVIKVVLGTITRNAPATMDVPATANFQFGTFVVQTSNANVNVGSILGGYITSGGTTWATRGAGGTIGPFTAYVADNAFPSATSDVDVQAGGGASFTAANSLRFNTPTAAPLDLSPLFQPLVVNTGGILVTSNVGGNPMSIVNGQITASGGTANPGNDLVVIQNNTAAAMTIGAVITNSGTTAIGLTKAGPGLLNLTGVNNFTGPTFVTGGTLQASAEALPTTNITVASGANVTFNESTVQPWPNSLTGPGSFTLTGNGALTISNSNFAYTGATTVSGGTLALPSNVALATSSVTVGAARC